MLPIQKVEELAGCEQSRCMQCTVCICGKTMEEMKKDREIYHQQVSYNRDHTTVSDPHLSLLSSSLKSIPWEVV